MQESRAMEEKPHYAVLNLDTYRNFIAASRGSPYDSTASCIRLNLLMHCNNLRCTAFCTGFVSDYAFCKDLALFGHKDNSYDARANTESACEKSCDRNEQCVGYNWFASHAVGHRCELVGTWTLALDNSQGAKGRHSQRLRRLCHRTFHDAFCSPTSKCLLIL